MRLDLRGPPMPIPLAERSEAIPLLELEQGAESYLLTYWRRAFDEARRRIGERDRGSEARRRIGERDRGSEARRRIGERDRGSEARRRIGERDRGSATPTDA